jgi:hypothetical protein
MDVLDLSDLPPEKLRSIEERQRRLVRAAKAAAGASSILDLSGDFPQKATTMQPDKEHQLTLLSSVMEITSADRTAALTLSATELELCRWFKTKPASFLATKQEQQSA